MALRYGCGVPSCKLCEQEAIDIARRLSSCTVNSTSMSSSSGASNQVATSMSTSAAANEQEDLTAMRHLCVSQVTEITQRNSSDTAIDTSSSPSSAFSSQVAASTSTNTAASVQMSLREIQARYLSLSQGLLPPVFPHQNMSSCNVGSISQTTQVTEITQRNSSDIAIDTSSSPSSAFSSQVAASTSTNTAASVQMSLREIQARYLSLSQGLLPQGFPHQNISSCNVGSISQTTQLVNFDDENSSVMGADGEESTPSTSKVTCRRLKRCAVQEGDSYAEEQLQQLQKQKLQKQEQQYHCNHSNTSNSHQVTLTQHHSSINHHHNLIPTMPNPGRYHHHFKTAQPQILEPSPEKTKDLDLEQFAKIFRQRRLDLGFSTCDVGLAMGKLYGKELSDTMISRFETLNLSPKNMCDLKPLLQKWLEYIESSRPNPGCLINPRTTRRKFSRIPKDTSVTVALEEAFLQNPQATSEEIAMLAESLGMEKKVVRVWFYNRRTKEKRINPPSAAMGSPTVTESATAMVSPPITESAAAMGVHPSQN